jgi:hypothetical protein
LYEMDTKLFFDPTWAMPFIEIKQEKTKGIKSKKKAKSKGKAGQSSASLITEVPD